MMKNSPVAIAALLAMLALTACEEEKVVVKEKRTYKGDIEVLNSCGEPGAAAKVRTFLREKAIRASPGSAFS